ncbi:hypothetical protein [Paraburkholderia nodosa]|uniref:hypothetical protein n=1 Tax=Paraburkholderia nodosa TaxID=392320 RepID=UPI0012B6A7EB|nr:hypothetical protein [Paraburkholderia nodosa]
MTTPVHAKAICMPEMIDVALVPVSALRPCHALRGATALTDDAAKADLNCINQVSCAFRNACLMAFSWDVQPSERAHCNANYATGNIVEPAGFSCIATIFLDNRPIRVAPQVAPHFRAPVAPKINRLRIMCCR